MALYHTYRPQDLKQVVGNNDVISALENMFSKNQVPHAILLQGPSGCGKTTIGRIIASKLGAIESDFSEIDSADFRGIDTVRNLRQNAQYKPIGAARVYLIDEVHKMTNDAQNALLKILEDTPTHVYFILATTDPQKLLKTIIGRCSVFEVKTLNDMQMKKLLSRILKEENESLSDEVLSVIINSAQGHSRDAINILEQVLQLPDNRRASAASQIRVNEIQSIELARLLIKGAGWDEVKVVLTNLKTEEPESIRRMILGYCQAILLKSKNDKAAGIMEEMMEPFYNSGFPQLVYACYVITTQH